MYLTFASFKDLEFGCIEQGFTHLMPDVPDPCNDALAALARGIFEAKKNLILINNLHPIMHDQLVQNDLLPALEKIEAPVQSLLSAMEYRGIAFYPNRLLNAQSQLEGHVQQLEEESRRITKDADFLLSSPQQVSAFLFDVLKLSMPAGLVTKTKEGSSHRSTSEETLNAMRAEMILRTGKPHPFIDVVLKFRRHNKMLTGFIKPLPGFCYKEQPEDFYPRIHPQWMQTVRLLLPEV
jgi:DNA polymerase I-like protein with 3'-5' exonuclease and polymerase domains